MEKNVPTVLKSLLQSHQLLGKQHTFPRYTTVNESLGIHVPFDGNGVPNGNYIEPGERPSMKLAVIGRGGVGIQQGSDGKPYSMSYRHKPTDTGLFEYLPFVMRPTYADIPQGLRQNYRLRKIVTVGSQQFIAYYGKILPDVAGIPTAFKKRTISVEGAVTETPFEHGASDLAPLPTVFANTNEPLTTTPNYVACSTIVPFSLDRDDVNRLIEVSQILQIAGDFVLTEIALCSCVDRQFEISANNLYTDSIAVQPMVFLSTSFPAYNFPAGVTYYFDVGNTEPLFEVEGDGSGSP